MSYLIWPASIRHYWRSAQPPLATFYSTVEIRILCENSVEANRGRRLCSNGNLNLSQSLLLYGLPYIFIFERWVFVFNVDWNLRRTGEMYAIPRIVSGKKNSGDLLQWCCSESMYVKRLLKMHLKLRKMH